MITESGGVRSEHGGDMPPEEFRDVGHRVVDWIADYLDTVEEYPVLAEIAPGDLRRALPERAPSDPETFSEILRDFEEEVMPGVTHWNHPAFFGYFAVTGSGPGILGEMLAAALNVNAMVWRSSPAGTELEEHVADWLRQLLGLPETFMGVINDTASHSSLYALAAAREAAFPDVGEEGLFGAPRGRIYASTEAHSSIDKAAMTLGLGRAGVRRVEADDLFRMKPESLRAAILDDIEMGVRPVAVVATLGTTSSTSVDPVAAVADVAEELGLWLHADAAYAGPAAMVPELREHFVGWERADSVVMNPHKWLFTPVDCSLLYCRRSELLRRAFSLTPEYLRTREAGTATNLMDYGVALGRRFRSLKLWFVLRYFGVEGIRERLREHVRLARDFAERVEAASEWVMVAPVLFSTAVFRFQPPGMTGEDRDRANLEILEEVNATGEAFLTHTRLDGRICLRLSVGNLKTRAEHTERAWTLLQEAARRRTAPAPATD